jgi:PII-like signaling protein
LPKFSKIPAKEVLTLIKGFGQQQQMQGHQALKLPKTVPKQFKQDS